MPKFIKVTRSDAEGSYILAHDEILNISWEFECLDYMDLGTTITLTIIEMSQEEFDKIPEFMGW